MALLQSVKSLVTMLDARLELLDVLGAALTEGRLGLSVALLPLLRRGIDLRHRQPGRRRCQPGQIRRRRGPSALTGFLPPFRFCCVECSRVNWSASR